MRKRRSVVLGLVATLLVAAMVGMLSHVIVVAGAGTAITICLVGLGPAFAAVALVAAVGAVAPPIPGTVVVASPAGEAPAEGQI